MPKKSHITNLLHKHFSQLATDLNVFLDPITQIPKLEPCLTSPRYNITLKFRHPSTPKKYQPCPNFLPPALVRAKETKRNHVGMQQ